MNELREFGRFRLDAQKKVLWYDDEPISLSLKSIELLCLLTETCQLVTKEEILERIWQNSFIEESNLTSHIYRLRKMFAKYGESDEIIQTIPKRGYRFTGEIIYFSSSPDFFIEKQTVTQTVIEEIENSIEPRVKQLPAVPKSSRWLIVGLVGLILISSLLSYFLYFRHQPEEIKSIAVLPLKTFDSKVADENLSLRLMDSIITKLSNLENISVRPTSSTAKFLQSNETTEEIGKKLAVDAILEGLIQRENNKLRITVQLVSVRNAKQIWTGQFDGEADKLLELQTTISVKLLNELNLRLTKEQQTQFAQRPTNNSEAYEEFLKGRYFWQKRTEEDLKKAVASFEKSVALDPNFADAYVGLADSYYLFFDYSYDTSPQNVEKAKNYLAKAIELNPNLADAYTTLGLLQTTYEWNWKEAENSLKKAKELAPTFPNIHHRYGTFLAKLRRFEEAESELRKAKELDPTSASINMNLGFILMNSKKYKEAIDQLQKTLELDSNFLSPRWYLARCYWHQGEQKRSLLESAKAIELGGDRELAQKITTDINSLDEKNVVKNWAEEWKKQLGPQGINDHDLAVLGFYQSDKEETLNRLERSVAARHPWATWMNAEPEFDFVRDEPRFQKLLQKMNLK
jgi:DNA-binding winged helix-turn-helix (wHTH) protein/TolB-like protein/cytochrome c-type biogenesis protein CcmH/NrfG